MKLVSRFTAIQKGLTKYFTGKPCKHGHVAERRVDNSKCYHCWRIQRAAGVKQWKKRNRDKVNERGRRYWRELKRAALVRYSSDIPCCACCSELHVEFLCIDHVGGGGNAHRALIGGTSKVYKWLRDNKYPVGFRVLCFNCNQAISAHGACPHQRGLNHG